MIVTDTSAVLEVLLHTPISVRHADRILDDERHAPHFIDLEFANALRRLTRAGTLEPSEAEEILDDFRRLPIERHAHTGFLQRIWQLRDTISAYDAAYIALAEALDAQLLTCDAKLSRTSGHNAKIVLLT